MRGRRKNSIKKLIVISGLPGSGKCTVAVGIAEKLKFPIFSVDPIESAILQSGIQRSFETGLAAYLIAETLADEQLSLEMSVVVDAVNSAKEARDTWRRLSEKHDARLVIIECVLERSLHRQRIESRVRNLTGIPEVTWDAVENRRHEYLEWEEERLILDTSNPNEINLAQAMDYIQSVDSLPRKLSAQITRTPALAPGASVGE